MNRPALWAIADQALSGLSNVLLLVFVARSSGSAAFGSFSILYAVYVMALSLQRAAVGGATLIRPRSDGSDSSAARLALLTGVVSAVIVLATALWLSVPAGLVAVLCLGMPVLLLQDIHRYVRLRDRQSHVAALSDGIWVAIAVALFAALTATQHASATTMTAAWTFGGLCAAVYLVRAPGAPRLRGGESVRAWLAERRGLVSGLGLDTLLPAIGSNASAFALVALCGPGAFAQVRAADTLVSPLQSLTAAVSLVMLPRLSRRTVDRRLVLGASAGFTLVSVVYCGALLLLPDDTGRSLLGQNWDHARDVLPFMAIGYTASCLAVPFVTVLKAKEHVRRFLVLRVVATVGDIIGMVGGGLVASGRGAAYGVSLSRTTSSAAYVVWTRLEDDRPEAHQRHEQPASAAAV